MTLEFLVTIQSKLLFSVAYFVQDKCYYSGDNLIHVHVLAPYTLVSMSYLSMFSFWGHFCTCYIIVLAPISITLRCTPGASPLRATLQSWWLFSTWNTVILVNNLHLLNRGLGHTCYTVVLATILHTCEAPETMEHICTHVPTTLPKYGPCTLSSSLTSCISANGRIYPSHNSHFPANSVQQAPIPPFFFIFTTVKCEKYPS